MVDDESTDGTNSIIENLNITNLVLIKQKNTGAGAARNLAFKHANGSFIKFLDADDLINPEAIAAQVKLALENPDHLISGKWGRFYENNLNTFKLNIEEVWKDMDPQQWMIQSWKKGANMTQPGIFLIPRVLIEKAGVWYEELSKGPCDDMEFFTRIMLAAKGIKFCKDSILYYRSGINGSLSGLKQKESFKWFYKTIDLSTTHLLTKNKSQDALQAAAVQFKLLMYKAFPYNKQVSKQAEEKAKLLGNAKIKSQSGGFTKILEQFIGWKLTLQFKMLLGIKKLN